MADETTDSWTFNIPACNVDALQERIGKLAKKSVKLGQPFPEIIRGERFSVKMKDEHGRKYTQDYVKFTVKGGDALVKMDGWTFMGTIEHGADDAGNAFNLVRMAPWFEGAAPKGYRTDKPTCDHCNTVRRRNETFIVKHDDDGLRRVGRNCLKDYTGHGTAKQLMAKASFLAQFRACFSDCMDWGYAGRGETVHGLLPFLSRTALTIRKEGWLSKGAVYRGESQGTPTAVITWADLEPSRKRKDWIVAGDAEDQDGDIADAALEWARNIDPDTDSDYLHSVRVIAQRGYVRAKDSGIAASIVSCYQRDANRRAAAAKRAQRGESNWLGEVGQRFGGKGAKGIESVVGEVIKRFSFDGMYGATTLVIVQTQDGDEVVWYASTDPGEHVKVGAWVKVTGTIKRHGNDKRTGRKQTHINRAKLVVDVEPVKPNDVTDIQALFEEDTADEAAAVQAAFRAVTGDFRDAAPAQPAATTAAPVPVAHVEPQPAASGTQTLAIVLTAKTPTGSPVCREFSDPKAAVQAAADLRADGAINWRTVRYTLNGQKVTTAALRKL